MEVVNMAVLVGSRNIRRAAGAAGAAAPYVREIVTDGELRDSARMALRAIARLYNEMSADERLRNWLLNVIAEEQERKWYSLLRSRDGSIAGTRSRRLGIVVLALGTGVLIGVFAYPRSRQRITKAAGDARGTVTDVATKARDKTAETARSARDRITSRVGSSQEAA
jgi:hypothetical protein